MAKTLLYQYLLRLENMLVMILKVGKSVLLSLQVSRAESYFLVNFTIGI